MLAATGLTKRFGGLVAVREVSIRLEGGEVLGVIGPNGAGKTTLVNLLSGLYPPTGGEVTLDGKPITALPMHRVAGLGIARTFQQIRLFRTLSVFDNVSVALNGFRPAGFLQAIPGLGRAAQRSTRARVDELLDFVGLDGRAEVMAGELPFGDQRRLEIARALALAPRFLLLDEPASGMNEAETEALALDIDRVRETGCGVMLIEHDISLIRRCSTRVVAMNFGELLVEGTSEEVLAHPTVVEAYLGS